MQPLQLHLMLQFLVVRLFTFTKSFVAFSGFALFLEYCVGRRGPGDGVSLSDIANSKRYAVAGHRAQNDHYRTLLVHVVILCLILVRLFPLSLGQNARLRIINAL